LGLQGEMPGRSSEVKMRSPGRGAPSFSTRLLILSGHITGPCWMRLMSESAVRMVFEVCFWAGGEP